MRVRRHDADRAGDTIADARGRTATDGRSEIGTAADDRELLRPFADHRDEPAFRAIVERHGGLVHGVAMRRTGDPQAVDLLLVDAIPASRERTEAVQMLTEPWMRTDPAALADWLAPQEGAGR